MSRWLPASTPVCHGTAILGILVAVGGAGFYSWTGLLIGTFGALVFLLGLLVAKRRLISFGASIVFAGTIVAGTEQAPVLAVLIAVASTVIAWDLARYGIGLTRQLGTDARTLRPESVHTSVSAGVGLGTVVIGYSVFQIGLEGQPATALVLLLLAAVLLVVALR